MKKSFMLIAAMLLALGVRAQNPISFTVESKSNQSFDLDDCRYSKVIAEENGNLLFTLRNYHKKNSEIIVRWADKKLNVVAENILEVPNGCALLASSVTEDHVVLMYDELKEKTFTVHRVVLDKQTLKERSSDIIFTDDDVARGSNVDVNAVESPNGDFFALQVSKEIKPNFIGHDKDDKDVKAFSAFELMVLDNEMQLLWKRSAPIALSKCLWIGNDADVYMVCANSTSEQLKIAQILNDDEYEYTVNTDNKVFSARILNVIDGCVVIGGVYLDKIGSKDKMEKVGVYGMSFDISKGRLVGQDYHPVTPQEDLVMQNEKLTSTPKGCLPGSVKEVACTPADFGGAMLLSDCYGVTSYMSGGGRTTTYYRAGMLAFAVNKNGEIIWSVPVRHFESSVDPDSYASYMFSKGDVVIFTNVEGPKSPLEYDIQHVERPAFLKSNMALYAIKKDGSVSKSVVFTKIKDSLYGSTTQWFNGNYYMLQCISTSAKLVTINCE